MGLENLKSVFSKIYKNTLPEKGIHGGLTNESPSTPPHPEEHSLLDILPNVARLSPENLSMNPTLEWKGRHGDKIIDKEGNVTIDIPHPAGHSVLDDGIDNTKYSDILDKNQSPIATPDGTMTDYSIELNSEKLATGIHSGVNVYDKLNSEKIKKRTFDGIFPNVLGKDNRLGGPPDGDSGPWRL